MSNGRRRGGWLVGLSGLGVVAWWALPLIRPRGTYGGCYGYRDVILGFVMTVVWVAALAVAVSPSRWRRPLALRLTAVLGSMLIAVAFCDMALTVGSVRFGHFWYGTMYISRLDNEPDPELIWKHRPGLSWHGRKSPDCAFVHLRTDQSGFRNPPGVRQADLVFIGDSVTEAGEVNEGVTFVRKASGALGASAANLGVFGYGPQQELAVLRRYGLAYRPRVVVWQVTEWNDLEDAVSYLQRDSLRRPSLPWRFLYEQHSPVVKLITAVFPPKRRHLVDFRRSDGVVDRRVIWPYYNPVPVRPVGMEETRRALSAAQALCREHGITLVVLLVPLHQRVLAPYVLPKGPVEEFRYRPPGGLDEPGDLAHALAEHCRQIGCAMIDLTPALRRRAAVDNRHVYIKNDTHLDVDGHEVVASELVQFLCSRKDLAWGVASPDGIPARR